MCWKIAVLLLFFGPLFLQAARMDSDSQKDEVLESGLRELIGAVERRDYERLIAKMPPDFVEKLGGTAAAVRILREVDEEARKEGMDPSKVQLGKERNFRSESRMVSQGGISESSSVQICVVPTSVVMREGEVRRTLYSSIVGIKEGKDGPWYFLEGSPATRKYLSDRHLFKADMVPPQRAIEEGPGANRRYLRREANGLQEVREFDFLLGASDYSKIGTFVKKTRTVPVNKDGKRVEEVRSAFEPETATRQIPAKVGQTFGYNLLFLRPFLIKPILVETFKFHPEFTEPKGVKTWAIKKRELLEPGTSPVALGHLFSFTEDAAYEIQPGEWLFEHYAEGTRIFAISFDVFSPEDSKPGDGQWADGRYRNSFFGFQFQAPEKWKSVSQEELDRLGEGEGESTEMENLVAAQVEKNPPVELFQMMESGADGEYTGQMLSLSAEKIVDRVENDVELLERKQKALASFFPKVMPGMTLVEMTGEQRRFGRQVRRLTFRFQDGEVEQCQRYYLMIRRGFHLNLILAADTLENLEKLDPMADYLRFDY